MAVINGDPKHNGADPSPLPIVIAGGGCVGLFLALLLVQSNIPNRVIVSVLIPLPSVLFNMVSLCRSSNHYIQTPHPPAPWPINP